MIYSPREDSFLLEKCVKRYANGKKVLDVGTGSGIQAVAAKKSGAVSVLACDICKDAVEKVNFLRIRCIKSNLFSKIKGKFDLITFNPPYLPRDKREPKDSQLATTGGKRGDEIILRFLRQAKSHLNKDGKILLLLSSLTPRDEICKLLKRLFLSYRIIDSEKLFFETLEVWEIKKV